MCAWLLVNGEEEEEEVEGCIYALEVEGCIHALEVEGCIHALEVEGCIHALEVAERLLVLHRQGFQLRFHLLDPQRGVGYDDLH